ncbi:MAG TPA: hypothetical protein VFW00_14350 [Rhodocyclaceae bacterium]|nr:hypothetical protein [Rhodocyclaceae bacterium]
MRILLLPVVASTCLTIAAHAADNGSYRFDYESALHSPIVTPVLDPAIRIVLDEHDLPEYAYRSDPDDYKRSSKFSGFFNSPNVEPAATKCMEAFASVLTAMQEDARNHEYNVIFLHSDGSADGKKQFSCQQGFASNDVKVIAEFVETTDLANKIAANPPEAIKPPPRKRFSTVVTFSIAEVMHDPDVDTQLHSTLTLQWGSRNVPAYSKRRGPDEFNARAWMKQSTDDTCKTAFVSTMKDMMESARNDGYNAIVRIHSSLDNQPAPDESLFECDVERDYVLVSLTGVAATLK